MAPPGANGALSARTVLEVADGLRWSDPRLGASLAEHAVRLAGEDAAVRTAAERSVIRSLAEVDRFDEVVTRATPLLEEATVREDRDDLAGLLVDLAAAALALGQESSATRLVAPIGPDEGLPARTVAHAALLRAQLAGAGGDLTGADHAARTTEAALDDVPEPDAGLVRRDLARARAAACSRGGDSASALEILTGAVSTDVGADADGGRRSLLAAADQVDLLLDTGRPDEALERGRALIPDDSAAPPVVRAAARIRLALAERVHLAGGAIGDARAQARTAADQLEAAGHDAAAARAWEVVATAAERAGELGAALAAVRHGHELESRARDRREPTVRVLSTIAASTPKLPVRPAPEPVVPAPTPPEPSAPGPVAPDSAGPAADTVTAAAPDVESLLADARSPGTNSRPAAHEEESTPRRRRHQRQDPEGSTPWNGSEGGPAALARLLGGAEVSPEPDAEPSPSNAEERANGSRPPADGTGDLGGGRADLSGTEPSPRFRHAVPPADGLLATPSPPTFDAFSTAPGSQGGGPEEREGGSSGSGEGELFPPLRDRPDPSARPESTEFPDIDPADPLGSGTSSGPMTRNGASPAEKIDPPDAAASWRGSDPYPLAPARPTAWDVAEGDRLRGMSSVGLPPGSRPDPAGADREELDELALTLTGLLAEYGVPEPPSSPRREVGGLTDLAVPSARRDVSGAMPLPAADQRSTAVPAEAPSRVTAVPGEPAPGGRARPGENSARLADLLAEAMDAFRHTGPGDQAPESGAPRSNGLTAGGAGEAPRSNGDGSRGPGVGARRG